MRGITVLKRAVMPLVVGGTLAIGPSSSESQATSAPPTQAPAQGFLTSWTSDRHVLKEGDIITILVDENLLASAQKEETASQMRDRDLSLRAGTSGGSLRTRNDVGERNRGESSRTQRFSGELSARVLEVSPSGMARLEGTKKVQIDEVEEELLVRGWVRPQDLSLHNTVESWRLSDTEILFTSNGTLGQTGGFWSKLLNWIWP